MASSDRPRLVLVVPCYNEEQRLDTAAFEGFAAARPEVRFVMVNDGSRDGTLARLEQLRCAPSSSAASCADIGTQTWRRRSTKHHTLQFYSTTGPGT
jgi:hypothetical protein